MTISTETIAVGLILVLIAWTLVVMVRAVKDDERD